MSAKFDIDIGKLRQAMTQAPNHAGKGATRALGEIKDDWVRESRDVAPLDKSNLRKQIHGSVKDPGIDGYVEIEANAMSDIGGKRFNYAYYIHEGHMRNDGKTLRRPGTIEEFLKVPGESRKEEYKRWLIEDIQSELKKAGW